MTEQECTDAYDILANYLESNDMAWVLQQVEMQLDIGKEIEKEIEPLSLKKELPTLWGKESSYRKGEKTTSKTYVAYTAKERLSLLIDAIEESTSTLAEISTEQIQLLNDNVNQIEEIFFESEHGATSHKISIENIEFAKSSGDSIKKLLDELRAEV